MRSDFHHELRKSIFYLAIELAVPLKVGMGALLARSLSKISLETEARTCGTPLADSLLHHVL